MFCYFWAHCDNGLAILTTEFNVKVYNAARMINKAIELINVVTAGVLLELFAKAKNEAQPSSSNAGRILGRLGISKENVAAYLNTMAWLPKRAVGELFKDNPTRIAVECLKEGLRRPLHPRAPPAHAQATIHSGVNVYNV